MQWGSASLKQNPSRADREASDVKVSIHAQQVTPNDPHISHAEGITTNAVLIRELAPTDEHDPIESVATDQFTDQDEA